MFSQDSVSYSCFTIESIRLMAEAASIPELSIEVASTMSEDATYRLRQIVAKAVKFMRHSNRSRLTCSDVNKALQISDCQPVFGYECAPDTKLNYLYSTEAQVFSYEDSTVDLAQRYRDRTEARHKLLMENHNEAMPNMTIAKIDSV